MPAWKLELEYDGTRYRGWQIEHNARTIQGEMSAAARQLFEAKPEIFGAEPTEPGVHALRQIVHLKVATVSGDVTPRKLLAGFNEVLPADINVRNVTNVPDDFHARHDAAARYYIYQIATRRTAFAKNFVWWVKDEHDHTEMAAAAKILVGRHDLGSFCESGEEKPRSTVTNIFHSEVFVDADLICFRIGAAYFSPLIIRRIVGSLAEVGRGKMSLDAFSRLLRFRSDAGSRFTAPPSGLFLEKVLYKGDEPPRGKNAAIRLP
jgi:tRNA pseudouridine38-40 synthase